MTCLTTVTEPRQFPRASSCSASPAASYVGVWKKSAVSSLAPVNSIGPEIARRLFSVAGSVAPVPTPTATILVPAALTALAEKMPFSTSCSEFHPFVWFVPPPLKTVGLPSVMMIARSGTAGAFATAKSPASQFVPPAAPQEAQRCLNAAPCCGVVTGTRAG